MIDVREMKGGSETLVGRHESYPKQDMLANCLVTFGEVYRSGLEQILRKEALF